jgi:hypothetical protein
MRGARNEFLVNYFIVVLTQFSHASSLTKQVLWIVLLQNRPCKKMTTHFLCFCAQNYDIFSVVLLCTYVFSGNRAMANYCHWGRCSNEVFQSQQH